MPSTTIEQFKEIVTLMMCSDPWPVDEAGNQANQAIVDEWADAEAIRHGYANWLDAYLAL